MNEFDLDNQFDSDIDLTPLIDVIFLLIIFFVLATTFSKPVLDVVLPSSQAASQVKSDKKDLIVEVNEMG
ncbi:MAG: biopolymer transporter ExbD, partial [Verrucomicrobiota bacterium]|nr:biopolymer transporter ExbD [Verrucomicrobiota bacterium]